MHERYDRVMSQSVLWWRYYSDIIRFTVLITSNGDGGGGNARAILHEEKLPGKNFLISPKRSHRTRRKRAPRVAHYVGLDDSRLSLGPEDRAIYALHSTSLCLRLLPGITSTLISF